MEQQNTPQKAKNLSERLKKAYKRISPGLRTQAANEFAEFHHIHIDTFRKKVNGTKRCIATEGECEWLESWRPKPVEA